MGNADLELRQKAGGFDKDGNPLQLRNATCLFNDLQTDHTDPFKPGAISEWESIAGKLAALEEDFPTGLAEQVEAELEQTLEVAKFSVSRAIARRRSNRLTNEQKREFKKHMESIIEEHRRMWLLRSRPGGLDDSCAYYQKIIDEMDGK